MAGCAERDGGSSVTLSPVALLLTEMPLGILWIIVDHSCVTYLQGCSYTLRPGRVENLLGRLVFTLQYVVGVLVPGKVHEGPCEFTCCSVRLEDHWCDRLI